MRNFFKISLNQALEAFESTKDQSRTESQSQTQPKRASQPGACSEPKLAQGSTGPGVSDARNSGQPNQDRLKAGNRRYLDCAKETW